MARHGSSTARFWTARIGLLLVGAAGVVAVRRARPAPRARPEAVAYWVADRAGGVVFGLGPDLHPCRTIDVPWPTRVAPRPAGGVWVVSAHAADPAGPQRLHAFDSHARELARHELGPVLDLAADAVGASAIVAGRSTDRLVDFELGSPPRRLVEAPGLRCCARSGALRLVGADDGAALVFEVASGRGRAWALGTCIVDVRAGPTPGSFWVLDRGVTDRLLLLDRASEPVRVLELRSPVASFVTVPGDERVWLVHPSPARLACVGPDGVSEVDPGPGPLGVGCAGPNGTLVLARGGALSRWRASGVDLPGQGGFALVADVVAVRSARLSSP